jgi:rubrerythrin
MLVHPKHSKALESIIDSLPDASVEEGTAALSAVRLEYIREADPLGSIPPPPTMKGKAKSGAKALTGNRLQAFIDKLAERLAFERGGTRLYDAVLAKFQANPGELADVSDGDLLEIRNQEAEHALMVQACLEQLGADPTAQTPSADLVGIQSAGLLQAVSDPRTTLAQTLNTALAAELIDNDGWQMLIAMANEMGQDRMAERFQEAMSHEETHLANVRRWYQQLTLASTKLVS